jgi:hypothetical protein
MESGVQARIQVPMMMSTGKSARRVKRSEFSATGHAHNAEE